MNTVKTAIHYQSIHTWLREEYGKADRCEMKKCPKICKIYQWALKKGHMYQKKRNNFFRLCVSCHSIYDGKMQILARMKWRPVVVQNENHSLFFPSIKEALKVIKSTPEAVANVLHGRALTSGGYKWQYAK